MKKSIAITQMVCRKCQQAFPLATGAICPQCYSNLCMVEFIERGLTPVTGNDFTAEKIAASAEHYTTPDGLCSLCGQSGIIDTAGVKTPAGVSVGRLNFCICPNWQALKETGLTPAEAKRILAR